MDSLECKFCLQKFDLHERIPLMFTSCGHTLCSKCIQAIILREEEKLSCPLDKITHPIFSRDKGLKCFPVNQNIVGVLKKEQE